MDNLEKLATLSEQPKDTASEELTNPNSQLNLLGKIATASPDQPVGKDLAALAMGEFSKPNSKEMLSPIISMLQGAVINKFNQQEVDKQKKMEEVKQKVYDSMTKIMQIPDEELDLSQKAQYLRATAVKSMQVLGTDMNLNKLADKMDERFLENKKQDIADKKYTAEYFEPEEATSFSKSMGGEDAPVYLTPVSKDTVINNNYRVMLEKLGNDAAKTGKVNTELNRLKEIEANINKIMLNFNNPATLKDKATKISYAKQLIGAGMTKEEAFNKVSIVPVSEWKPSLTRWFNISPATMTEYLGDEYNSIINTEADSIDVIETRLAGLARFADDADKKAGDKMAPEQRSYINGIRSFAVNRIRNKNIPNGVQQIGDVSAETIPTSFNTPEEAAAAIKKYKIQKGTPITIGKRTAKVR